MARWVDDDGLYLEPDAAFADAQRLAQEKGESLPIGQQTLWKRLKEKNHLASWDAPRQKNTVRRTLGDVRGRDVIHLHKDVLSRSEPSKPSTNPVEGPEEGEKWTFPADGFDGRDEKRPQETSTQPAEMPAGGQFGRSDAGVNAGGFETNGKRIGDDLPSFIRERI